jgi:hypothetical protein
MAKVVREKALEILKEVPLERVFWVYQGPVVKRLEELPPTLKSMSTETFQHHVTSEKNDFAKWIDDVVLDKDLASALFKVKSKASVQRMVSARVKELKKCAA